MFNKEAIEELKDWLEDEEITNSEIKYLNKLIEKMEAGEEFDLDAIESIESDYPCRDYDIVLTIKATVMSYMGWENEEEMYDALGIDAYDD